MDLIKLGIVIGGILSLSLAVFHTQFYKQFQWAKDFEKISLLNHKIYYTINIALILLFLIFAYLSFVYSNELSQGEGLAGGITLSYSFFWLWRTIWQVTYFSPSKIKVNPRQKFRHYLLTVIFMLLFLVYLFPVASNLTG